MALGAALKDRARRVVRVPSPRRVEGKTVLVAPVEGPWFKARLSMPSASESADSGRTRRVVITPTLLIGRKDSTGRKLTKPEGGCVIGQKDRIEVQSAELGNAMWEVSGHPTPIRKKRTVLGYEVPLSRVEDDTFERPSAGMSKTGGASASGRGGS